MSGYLHRVVDALLDELSPALPAIALEGAKGVGKTESARRRARTVLRLDDPADVELFRSDPELINQAPAPILLDEWQRLPEVWDRVRRAVDHGAVPGRFLLTGSAAPAGASIHSGAGRIDPIRMRPLSLAERFPGSATVSLASLLEGAGAPLHGETPLAGPDYIDEILRSGFPGIRQLRGRALRGRLDGYLDNVVRREFPEQGLVVRQPETLRRWLAAYAAATSTVASYATILRAASGAQEPPPAKTTTIAYRDVLSQLWLLDPVSAWQPDGAQLTRKSPHGGNFRVSPVSSAARGPLTRLARAPKHHLADPALAARLLGFTERDFAPGGSGVPMLGPLFEHLVTLGVQTFALSAEAHVGHLRTSSGDHEIDIVVERGTRIVAIEVKLARSVDDHDVSHLNWLRERIGDRLADRIIVTTGPRAYRRPDGVGVVPAALLGP